MENLRKVKYVAKNSALIFFLLLKSFFTLKKRVSFIGDSHSRVYNNIDIDGFLFYGLSVSGATASGVNNPNSKTKAKKYFDAFCYFDFLSPRLIVQLGEVDTGFVIWYRAHMEKESIRKSLERTLYEYKVFLEKLSFRYNKVVVISSPLPTIKDGETLGDVANLRKSIKTSQKRRTKLTLIFNKEMKIWCESRQNIFFLDLDECSYNPFTGLVREELVNKNVADHHYNETSYLEIIEENLKQFLI